MGFTLTLCVSPKPFTCTPLVAIAPSTTLRISSEAFTNNQSFEIFISTNRIILKIQYSPLEKKKYLKRIFKKNSTFLKII
jgi:hypothetical protein